MTTAIDTNVLVALWDGERPLRLAALAALNAALAGGGLVISAPVYAELMAAPDRDTAFLDLFLTDTGIRVDWVLEEPIWRAAGRAFQAYARVRRKQRSGVPRRLFADFLIGAHASETGCRLLTLDTGLYRSAFPALRVINI